MSVFDNSLEPVKRIGRKARECRLLATQNVKESLARHLGEEQDAFDHSPVSFVPDSGQHSVGILLVHGFYGFAAQYAPGGSAFYGARLCGGDACADWACDPLAGFA